MIYARAVRRIIQASAGIEYVGGKIDTSPSSFDTMGLTGGIGTQAKAGDFILIYQGRAYEMSAVSGFTQVQNLSRTSLTLKTYFSADYRIAAAAGESFTSDSSRLAMMVFRGVGGVESSDGSTSGSNGIISPPAVTPVAPGSIIVAGGASNNGAIVNSPPAGALHSVVHAPNNGMDIGMCVGTTEAWTSTGSQSGASKCVASIVLAPA